MDLVDQAAGLTSEVRFGRPAWVPRSLGLQVARIGAVIVATLLSLPLRPDIRNTLPVLLAVEFIVVCVVLFGSQARLRLRGGLPPVLLGPENITLPRHSRSLRTLSVPYKDIRSISVSGQGRTAQLIIDGGRRAWRFPVESFAEPDAPARLQNGFRQHITGLPEGEARWNAIKLRHDLAERIGPVRPWASWGITLVALLCFAVQAMLVNSTGEFGLLDAGANAALLVHEGQWFRLVTASLLHQNAQHVIGNVLFVLAIGGILEPLIGWRQLVLVMLWSCLASQVVSASVGLQHGAYVFAVGNPGGVYGLMGALAAVTWRFGAALPGGYRLPVRAWLLVGLSVVVFPFVVTRVDHAAHASGFAAGALAGLLLLRGREQLGGAAPSKWAADVALAVLACIFAWGITAAALHAGQPQALASDRYKLAAGMLAHDHFPPSAKNFVAWAIATDQAAPKVAVEDARLPAQRGVMEESYARGPDTPLALAIRDTEALLTFRLGYDDKAIGMELPLLVSGRAAGDHLTEFVEQVWRRHGLTVEGDAGPAPILNIGQGVLRLHRSTPVAVQTDVLALVHRGNVAAGLLRFQLVPGFVGTQVLPLPSSTRGPGTTPPPAIWTDGKSTIDIARLDANGCYCQWPSLVPAYYPHASGVEQSP